MVPWRARISIKHVGLASLTVLLTLITITMHISRTHRTEGTPLYKSASAVVFAELFKLVASLVLSLGECRQHIEQGNASASSIEMRRLLPNDSLASGSAENGGNDRRNNVTINLDRSEVNNEIDHDAAPSTGSTTFLRLVRQIYRETFSSDWYMVALPAFLFTCQGNLAYYASSNLSVPIFQVSYQLKVMSCILRHFSWTACLSLTLSSDPNNRNMFCAHVAEATVKDAVVLHRHAGFGRSTHSMGRRAYVYRKGSRSYRYEPCGRLCRSLSSVSFERFL